MTSPSIVTERVSDFVSKPGILELALVLVSIMVGVLSGSLLALCVILIPCALMPPVIDYIEGRRNNGASESE